MASFFLPRLLQKRLFVAATSSLRSIHSLSSLHHLHFSSCSSHDSNPNSIPSFPKPLENDSVLGSSTHDFTVYPTFPHFSHLGPVSLCEATADRLIEEAQSNSLTTANPIVQLMFQREPEFGFSVGHLENVDLIPLSQAIGLEIEGDEEIIVIRADSVKKKRKRKMNKHKLRKLRKKLRRKT